MSHPRHHIPLGYRTPTARTKIAETPDLARWMRAIDEARRLRLHRLEALVALDGVALVESRSIQYGAHEIRVSGRVALSCTCPAGRAKWPCVHRAGVALWLWEQEYRDAGLACDLDEPHARALALTLVRRYLTLPVPARVRCGPGAAPDAQPQRSIA